MGPLLSDDRFAAIDELTKDLESVIDAALPRHLDGSSELTWAKLLDVREDVVTDLGLASRWPFAVLLDLVTSDPASRAVAAAITAEESAQLVGVARLIYKRFRRDFP